VEGLTVQDDDDDIKLQTYQDDLTTDDNATDPIMDEENDNPADELGIPEDEYADGLAEEPEDEEADVVDDYGSSVDVRDDRREYVEDQFENDDSSATTGSSTSPRED
jgi:hypothetical protein